MPLVTYIQTDGSRHTVDLPLGESIMRGALNHDIPGIVGECGGGLACATCHCFIEDSWIDRMGTPSPTETEMLECAAVALQPGSRLSCQIVADAEVDGLIVHVPERQF